MVNILLFVSYESTFILNFFESEGQRDNVSNYRKECFFKAYSKQTSLKRDCNCYSNADSNTMPSNLPTTEEV